VPDVEELLRKQADWQKSLRDLPWPEKIRMAARLRESVLKLCRLKPATSQGAAGIRAGMKEDPAAGGTQPT